MSDWYDASCHDRVHYRIDGTALQVTEVNSTLSDQRTLHLTTDVIKSNLFYATVPSILDCARNSSFDTGLRAYCNDVLDSPTMLASVPPAIMQFGDKNYSLNYDR